MRRFAILAVLGALVLSSCSQPPLTVREQAQYRRILDSGLAPMQLKEPVLSCALNLVAGAGYFYLEEWGHGVVALLLAPFSWAWGIPAGYMDARRINVRYTLEYYKRLEVEEP